MNSASKHYSASRRIFLAITVSSIAMSSPAFAAETAAADTNAADTAESEDIVVTAQLRNQRLIDTPISIGVLSTESLESGGTRVVTDVLRQLPGVNVVGTEGGNLTIAIRGLQPAAGSSTTGYYQDDVPFAFVRSNGLPEANSFDVERVEALRGPQGTLYGVNALGGVVRVITADADLDNLVIKGRGTISDGERSGMNYSADAAISAPLIPGKLAVRLVASYADYSGYIDAIPHPNFILPFRNDTGKRINSYTSHSLRFKVNIQPSETLNIKALYNRSRLDKDAPPDALSDYTTPLTASYQSSNNDMDVFNLALNYSDGNISIKSFTSYIDVLAFSLGQVGTFLPLVITRTGVKSFVQENRIGSDGDGAWQWQIGGIYRNTAEKLYQDPRPFAPASFTGGLRYETRVTNFGFFGDVTRKLFDEKFEITAGLRYNKERQVMDQQSAFQVLVLPSKLVNNKITRYDKLTGRGVLTWKPSRDATFYASYSTGFRPGLQQTATVASQNSSIPDAAPDTVTNYELGAKGVLFGGVLSYETAAYYMKYKGPQQTVNVVFASLGGQVINSVVNAGDADGYGVEAAFTIKPTRGLTFNAAVGWSGLEFSETISSLVGIPPVPVVIFQKGDRLNASPEWTYNIGADYTTPISDTVDFFASAQYTYTSKLLNRFLNGPTLFNLPSDKIGVLRASAGVDIGNWRVTVFGENLNNESGAIAPPVGTLVPPTSQLGVANRLRPRTIGLQASFKY